MECLFLNLTDILIAVNCLFIVTVCCVYCIFVLLFLCYCVMLYIINNNNNIDNTDMTT